MSDPLESSDAPTPAPEQLLQSCTNCATLLDVSDYELYAQIHCPICGTALRARTQFLNFHIQGLLGEGGMGSVFRAVDVNLNRPIALKVVKREHSSNPEYIEKFEHEAQITASVNHPHVVKVYSYGAHQGVYYIAMELVDKGTLDHLINLQGRVAEAQVLEVAEQIADGLQAAYTLGLIHRDVKPGNILFADAHTAKIVDFGLALLMEDEAAARGEVWGTPYYVAPEKLNHDPEDHRSDIYSLGGTLFHALAGRPPFEAETASMVALKHIKSQAVSLQAFAPDVSSATAYVINRMLLKNPEDRYQTYEELIEHIRYAREQLMENLNKPRAVKQRVVVESEEQQSILGIITGIALLIVVVSAILLWVFRDAIFTTEADRKKRILAEEQKALNLAAERIEQDYESARMTFLSGDFTTAQDQFAKIARAAKPPTKQWALFHAGLAAFLADEPNEARGFFKGLTGEPYSVEPEHASLANFFVNASSIVVHPERIPPATDRNFSAKNFEAIAPFAFALKNWADGEIAIAADHFRAFLKSKPTGENAWIAGYFPIAEKYAPAAEAFAAVASKAASAQSQEEISAALQAIRDTRSASQVQGKITERLNDLEFVLLQKLASASDAERQRIQELRAEFAAALNNVEQKARTLIAAGKFADARAELESLSIRDPDLDARRKAAIRKADWALRFKRMLVNDINGGGYPKKFIKSNGQETEGPIKKATDEAVFIATPYGEIQIPWSDVPPEVMLEMAEHHIARTTNTSKPDRQWYAGVFALYIGQDSRGKDLLLEASQAKESYKADLELFFESAP